MTDGARRGKTNNQEKMTGGQPKKGCAIVDFGSEDSSMLPLDEVMREKITQDE